MKKKREELMSVLCDLEGKCCINGSDKDREIVDKALAELDQIQERLESESLPVVQLDKNYPQLRNEEWVKLQCDSPCTNYVTIPNNSLPYRCDVCNGIMR